MVVICGFRVIKCLENKNEKVALLLLGGILS